MLTDSHMIDGDGDGVDMSYGNITDYEEMLLDDVDAFEWEKELDSDNYELEL